MSALLSEVQPFRITVYDGGFGRKGWVGNPAWLTVTPRWNGQGHAEIIVPSDHPRAVDLTAPGARAVIEHDVAWDDEDTGPSWAHLLSGPVRSWAGSGPQASAQLRFRVLDDWRLWARVLGWQVPGAPIGGQSAAEYRTITGPAETVAKTLLTENAVTRLGLPVTVAPDLGRGDIITVSTRMHPLADRLYPAVDLAGIGLTVRQDGSGLLVDAAVPTVRPRTLTEASGAVRAWTVDRSGPGATRAVGGGAGEGTARAFRTTVDAAREAEWGDVVEVFRDARDAPDATVLDARIVQTLTEGAPTSGISVVLADTPTLRYGRDLVVGDLVTLDVGGITVTDTLRAATLTWSPAEGLRTTPQVGDRTDDPDVVLAHAVAQLARHQRDLGRR